MFFIAQHAWQFGDGWERLGGEDWKEEGRSRSQSKAPQELAKRAVCVFSYMYICMCVHMCAIMYVCINICACSECIYSFKFILMGRTHSLALSSLSHTHTYANAFPPALHSWMSMKRLRKIYSVTIRYKVCVCACVLSLSLCVHTNFHKPIHILNHFKIYVEKFRNLSYLENQLEEHYNEEQEKFEASR